MYKVVQYNKIDNSRFTDSLAFLPILTRRKFHAFPHLTATASDCTMCSTFDSYTTNMARRGQRERAGNEIRLGVESLQREE